MAFTIIQIKKKNPSKIEFQNILLKYEGTGVIIAVKITARANGTIFFNTRTHQYSSDSDLGAAAFFSGAIREPGMSRLIYFKEAGECKEFTSVKNRGITTKKYPYKWRSNYSIVDPSKVPCNRTIFL